MGEEEGEGNGRKAPWLGDSALVFGDIRPLHAVLFLLKITQISSLYCFAVVII